MPSRFATLLRSVTSVHRDHFATDVVVAQAGTTITTPAVVHRAKAESRIIDGSTVIITTRQIRFTDLAQLRDDAIITVESLAYSVESILDPTEGVTAILTRSEVTEQSRQRYRR